MDFWTPLRFATSQKKKSSCPYNFLSAILGLEMAAPILWAPGKMRSFCREKPHAIKFLGLGGVFWLFFFGGGSADFDFMGARILLNKAGSVWEPSGA